MNPKRRYSASAFTLVELLIVIAILALLLAILLPVFASARDKARSTTCLSNLSQIGMAIQAYRQDNDERFPVAVVTKEGGVELWHSDSEAIHRQLRNAPVLQDALQPYVKEQQMYACPADTGGSLSLYQYANREDSIYYELDKPFHESSVGTSYLYRTETGFVETTVDAKAVDFASKPLSVSEIVILTDAKDWHTPRTTLASGLPSGRRNVLFADGHVKPQTNHGFAVLWLGSLGVP